jgi:hypothetical protein
MLSICVTIKNRSKVPTDKGTLFLFPNCLKSLSHSLTLDDNVELVIADWESTDWPLKDWIERVVPHIPIHIITIKSEGFSAGKGRNIAAEHSSGDVLFFMDADMIVNRPVLSYGMMSVSKGLIYYPTVKYEVENKKQIIHEGGGNLFISKDNFLKAGNWPEYWKHGFEDTDFAKQVKGVAAISVNNELSIFHQWHPQTVLFKNIHASLDPVKQKIVDDRKDFYQTQQDKQPKSIITAISHILKTNPHTTHSTLNTPVKADNRSLVL